MTPRAGIAHHTLVVLVENKAGVLARIAGLFSRRGFNIESLAVAPTDDERFSRITIVVDVTMTTIDQVIKQLDKLVNVLEISELDPATSVGIMKLLDRINKTGTTVVMATHDRGIVDTMRKRVIELDHGNLARDQARGVYE